ncbi:MAG TPA: hypothetical protein VN176_15160 [Verrucomicrobiae bacterium]|nr:hypothetical protein [Verrucomicrobiae bacterium]
MFKPTLLVLLVAAEMLAAPTDARPRFEDFAVKTIYQGTPAPPRLLTKGQRGFRTMIRSGAKSKVQFAGHYTVPMWGCGAGCSTFVTADSVSGKVYELISVVDLPDEFGQNGQPPERFEFHPNSRLLKINGCPNERDCGFYDYEMVDGLGLKLVRKELLPAKYQPQ